MLLTDMSPGPTFDRVYAALKEQLLRGRWAPGTHLEPAVLGDDLSASITPVRDALHRLAGERLIETQRHEGFRIPLVTEAQLRELYGWNGQLMAWALRRGGDPRAARAPGEASADEYGIGGLFLQIARDTGSPELAHAIASNNDRLGAFRVAETEVFEDWAGELASVAGCLRDNDSARLRGEVAAYHRRRQRAAPKILGALCR